MNFSQEVFDLIDQLVSTEPKTIIRPGFTRQTVPVIDPEHAANAILAARKMLNHVKQNKFAGQVLKVPIGINSGTVFAGAIGAEGRINYTVHGDAVNLAARLEAK